MNKKIVAIFIDWDNIRKGIFEEATKTLSKTVRYNDIDNVLKFINAFITPEEDIYRIFVYLCEPYSGVEGGIDYKQTPVYRYSRNFIDKLQVQNLVAIRKGNIAYRGLDINKKPIFEQKQVDMLLGLDIAHVSYNKLADRVLILSCDLDIIPAMKIARTNGLQVIWGCCPDVQTDNHNPLKKHSDFIREIKFLNIF